MLNFISSDNEKSLIQNGHLLSMSNAAAQINNISATNDFVSGLNYIVNTNKLSKNIDSSANLNKYINYKCIKNKISSEPLYTFTASSLDMNKSKINFALMTTNSLIFKIISIFKKNLLVGLQVLK